MAENFLDIVTQVKRPTITIDGARYEMRYPGELSIVDTHLLATHGSELILDRDLYHKDPEAAYQRLKSVIDKILDLILPDVPSEVRDRLTLGHVKRILDSFTGLTRASDDTQVEPQPRKKSSRASSASTADARKTG